MAVQNNLYESWFNSVRNKRRKRGAQMHALRVQAVYLDLFRRIYDPCMSRRGGTVNCLQLIVFIKRRNQCGCTGGTEPGLCFRNAFEDEVDLKAIKKYEEEKNEQRSYLRRWFHQLQLR